MTVTVTCNTSPTCRPSPPTHGHWRWRSPHALPLHLLPSADHFRLLSNYGSFLSAPSLSAASSESTQVLKGPSLESRRSVWERGAVFGSELPWSVNVSVSPCHHPSLRNGAPVDRPVLPSRRPARCAGKRGASHPPRRWRVSTATP